jgi:hypothetical protein
MNDEIVVPSHSCVEIQNFTMIPTCPQAKSRIHIDGVENVLHFLRNKFYKTNDSINVTESDESHESSSNTTTSQPTVARQMGSKKNWISLETSLELLPTTVVMESTDEESLHRNNGSLLLHTRLYNQLNRTRLSDVLLQNQTLPDPLTNESLVVDWNVLRSIHDLAKALESLSLTTLDVDWKHLHDAGSIRIICETITTNEFYLTCPSKYRLRKDGSCIGTGHTDFLFLCPTNYVLDDVAMIHHSVHHPKPRCIGKTPAYTKYICQNYTFDSDSNVTGFTNETLITLNSTQNDTVKDENVFQNETFNLIIPINVTSNFSCPETNKTQHANSSSTSMNISKCTIYGNFSEMDKHLRENQSSFIPHNTSTNLRSNTSVNISSTIGYDNFSQLVTNTTLVLNDIVALSTINETESNNKTILQSNLQQNTTTFLHLIADEYKSIQDKKCYAVKKTIKASYTPTYSIMEALYGPTATVEFFMKMAESDKLNVSMFFSAMPHSLL